MENENAKVKKTPKGLIIGIAAAVVAVVAVIAVVIILNLSSGSIAKVGNEGITKQEYLVLSKYNMTQFLASLGVQSESEAANYDWNQKYQDSTAKEQMKKSVLESLQEIKIQLAKAKEAGVKLEKTDLDNIEQSINEKISQEGSRAKAESAIKADYGVSLNEYRDVVKELSLAQKYIYSEQSKVKTTDAELQKYYDEHKADYDKVTVTHILIATTDLATGAPVSEGKKKEAKEKADDLLKQIQSGADMKALAEKNSDDKDQSGKVNNGGVYTFSKGEMATEFENWAFDNHKAGDTGIVETSYGYHVMRFEKREESKFDDAKEKIKSTIVSTKFNDEFTKRMDAWKKEFPLVKDEEAIKKLDLKLYKK